MAKKVIERIKNFADGTADVLGVIGSIPVIGGVFKGFMETTEKELGKALGKDAGAAEKDTYDEDLYGVAEHDSQFDDDEKKDLQEFELELRKKSPDKAAAFILFVAKKIKTFEQDVKETHSPAKGQSGPKKERSYKNIDEGVRQAVFFLKDLLKRKKFEDKVAFLEGKNVFSLIKKHPLMIKMIREAIKKSEGILQSVSVGGTIKVIIKKISEENKSSAESAKDFRERMRQRRIAAQNSRRLR